MSDMTSSSEDLPVLATVACPYCGVVVPDARFCGACGAHLVQSGLWASQRVQSYAAFPDEPVFRLSVVTSLFPHLSHRAKAPFRVGFGVLLLLFLVFCLAGTSAALIALSALGVPLLFLIYIWEVDPYEGSFLVPTSLCLLLGAGLGVGWAIVGSGYVDKALTPSLTGSLTSSTSLVAGLVVPAAGQLLMCVPMAIVLRLQRGPIESLDGFVAGATGALGFTLAATIDLMSPWLSNGELTHGSFLANLTQVVVRGVTLPLISALATGFIGMSYWAKLGARPTAARALWLTSPVTALVVALLIQIGLGFTDLAALSDAVVIGVHVAALAVLTVAMRIGLHYVLLHEALEVTIGPPRVCANCSHLVPAMAFCPQCGVAERAVSRPHRQGATWPSGEGVGAPGPTTSGATEESSVGAPWPCALPGAPGLKVGFPGAHEVVAPPHRLSHQRKIVFLLAGLGILTLALVIVAFVATPGPAPPCNPLQCQGPPIGHPGESFTKDTSHGSPVLDGTLYRNAQGFTVRYPAGASVQTDSDGIELGYDYTNGGLSTIEIEGMHANGATPQTAVEDFARDEFPDAQPVYQLPDPLIGYQPGYGEAFDVQPASASGSAGTDQVVVVGAVHDGFAILVEVEGSLLPTVTANSPYFNGHSSPAGTNLAYFDGDFIVNRIGFP